MDNILVELDNKTVPDFNNYSSPNRVDSYHRLKLTVIDSSIQGYTNKRHIVLKNYYILSGFRYSFQSWLDENSIFLRMYAFSQNQLSITEIILTGYQVEERLIANNIAITGEKILCCKFFDGSDYILEVEGQTIQLRNLTKNKKDLICTFKGDKDLLEADILNHGNNLNILITDRKKFILINELGFRKNYEFYQGSTRLNTTNEDSGIIGAAIPNGHLFGNEITLRDPFQLKFNNNRFEVREISATSDFMENWVRIGYDQFPDFSERKLLLKNIRLGYFSNGSFVKDEEPNYTHFLGIEPSKEIRQVSYFVTEIGNKISHNTIFIPFFKFIENNKSLSNIIDSGLSFFKRKANNLVFIFTRINEKEWEYFQKYPIDSILGMILGIFIASRKVKSRNIQGGPDSPENSVLHCYWAALMTKYLGLEKAKGILDNHEYGGTDKYDNFNNTVGIYIGNNYKGLSIEEILNICVDFENKKILANNQNPQPTAEKNFLELTSSSSTQTRSNDGRDSGRGENSVDSRSADRNQNRNEGEGNRGNDNGHDGNQGGGDGGNDSGNGGGFEGPGPPA